MQFEVHVDKRFEIISGLVLAYLKIYPEEVEDYDWVEVKNLKIPYVKDLISKINLNKYPKLIDYIKDINDCGEYSKLFLYFDEKMNPEDINIEIKAFESGSIKEFQTLVKKVYDNENLEEIFEKYKSEFKKIEDLVISILPSNFDINEIEEFYGSSHKQYKVTLSILANGGFGFQKEQELNYFRGVKIEDDKYSLNKIGFIICLFHEYSHPFVNKLVDKYYGLFENIDILLEDAIKSGLPSCYQNKKTLLYEYFVRTNSIVLAKKYIDKNDIEEEFEWYQELGFKFIKDITNLTCKNIKNVSSYEELLLNTIIPTINKLVIENK